MISSGTQQTTFSYGPDLQRWQSVTSDDGTPVRRVLYGNNYERVVYAADSVREFFYLGHDIIAVRLNGGPVEFYMAQTDHLGSLITVRDSLWASKFHSTYDAWGKPSVTKNTIGLLRGYTGHEMLPEYGLINTNGRLYDPLIGRFLSPDNYVQQPDNSQNFNRYSYCLNNPLKYTDPDGELFFTSVVSGFLRGTIKLLSGHGHLYSPFYEAYKNGVNDLKVNWGLFKGSVSQIVSRFTWELPQTILGYYYSSYRLLMHDIVEVRYFDGATYVIDRTDKNDGVTIGSFININTTKETPKDEKGNFTPYNNPLFAHEYGHYIQSQRTGWGYLFSHGIPSLLSANRNKGKRKKHGSDWLSAHHVFWTEIDANKKAADYFTSHGYLSTWDFSDFPTY